MDHSLKRRNITKYFLYTNLGCFVSIFLKHLNNNGIIKNLPVGVCAGDIDFVTRFAPITEIGQHDAVLRARDPACRDTAGGLLQRDLLVVTVQCLLHVYLSTVHAWLHSLYLISIFNKQQNLSQNKNGLIDLGDTHHNNKLILKSL